MGGAMTTPTTPAADAVRDAFEQWVASEGGPTTKSLLSARSNDDHYKGFIWLRQSLAAFRAATALATARESAILADVQRYRYLRDIKRRDCLTLTGPDAGVWCDAEDEDRNLMLLTEDDLDQAIDAAMQKERKLDAYLAAPAVEG